ncbi:UPF0175 family protein [Archaeoglobus profundus]|uniref:PX domain-containing protein n=1 Tax=Archaeoglobus profundus (strain DSM 5631 / JCM 9629 / NBRC 100127 / Av18) TaxID=572546 RepID=D2RDN2_ARCPA|nr:UPF0175 family protein [Archaeoglobus profundus]ADB58226.1 protein of unknown function UPF0175 [Archaeoglobus profundus DSM 5631]
MSLKVSAFEKEVSVLLKKYSEEELLKEAIRALFEVNPQLKLEVAVELYKDGEISLEKAAEIASMGVVEFREIISRKFGREVDSKGMEERVKKLEKYL